MVLQSMKIMNALLSYEIPTLVGLISVKEIVAFIVVSGLVVYAIRELLM